MGERRRHRVPDQEDPAVDRVQPLLGNAVADRAAPQPCGRKLRARHHTVLPRGDPRDRGIRPLADLHNAQLGSGRVVRRALCIAYVHNARRSRRLSLSRAFCMPTGHPRSLLFARAASARLRPSCHRGVGVAARSAAAARYG